jgi:DNA processing protein
MTAIPSALDPPAGDDAPSRPGVGLDADPIARPEVEAVRRARIALAHLAEPGLRVLGQLVLGVGPVEALRRIRSGEVSDELRAAVDPRLAGVDLDRRVDQALLRAERLGVRLITPEEDEWSRRLDDLVEISRPGPDRIARDTYPPHCIWLRGEPGLADACEQSVAVVGSRASTSYGDHVAGELAFGLAERGWTVVSGGAYGIDAAAHRGALAAGGCTVAVLACGIDRPYPPAHASLFDRIGEYGLLLSEWPPGSDPHKHRFLVRNRVIAALSLGTVVVEANVRSGARNTAKRARELDRRVMAVPGPVTSAMSAGCVEEMRREGTTVVATVAHVVEEVGRIGFDLAPVPRAEESPLDRLSELERRVLDGARPRKIQTAEQIAAVVGVSEREARRALPALEAAGFVAAVDGGYRLRRRSDDKPRAGRT